MKGILVCGEYSKQNPEQICGYHFEIQYPSKRLDGSNERTRYSTACSSRIY